jgi:hypothetical protein
MAFTGSGVEAFTVLGAGTVTSGGTTAPSAGTSQSWTVTATVAFPVASTSATPPGFFYVTDVAANSELMLVTVAPGGTGSGQSWTVTRGADGTTPVTHSAGFSIVQVAGGQSMRGFQSPNWLNVVTEFGADPTGSADSTTPIQNALNAAPTTGWQVYLPPGTYKTGPLTVPGYVTFAGAGVSSVLSAKAGSTGQVIGLAVPSTTRYVTIRDMFVECNSIASLSGVVFNNAGLPDGTPGFHQLLNVVTQDSGTGAYGFQNLAIGTVVDGCTFENSLGNGVYAGGSDSRYTDSTVAGSGSHGFHVIDSNCCYTSCKVYYAGQTAGVFSAGQGSGFFVDSTAGKDRFVGCEVQDSADAGWYFSDASTQAYYFSMIGNLVDSCNAGGSTGGAGAAYQVYAVGLSTFSGNISLNRGGGAGTITNGLAVYGYCQDTVFVGNIFDGSATNSILFDATYFGAYFVGLELPQKFTQPTNFSTVNSAGAQNVTGFAMYLEEGTWKINAWLPYVAVTTAATVKFGWTFSGTTTGIVSWQPVLTAGYTGPTTSTTFTTVSGAYATATSVGNFVRCEMTLFITAVGTLQFQITNGTAADLVTLLAGAEITCIPDLGNF